MRATRIALYDSFAAARGSLKPLFSATRSRAQLEREVRRLVLPRSRHEQRLSKAQQRSWVRANLGLILQESRRERDFAVAAAALQVALTEKDWLSTVDPVWVKDAAAACRSPQELRELQRLLVKHPMALAGLQGSEGRANSGLLAVLLGGSAAGAAASNAVQLGTGDSDDAEKALRELGRKEASDGTARQGLVDQLSPEEQVAFALARTTTTEPAGDSSNFLAAPQRTMAAIRRLADHREGAVVAPNQSFARYVLRQGIVQNEVELMALVQAMRARPARLGFRVHLSHPHGAAARQLLSGREGVARVSWLPVAAGAYTLDCTNSNTTALHANRTLLRALAKERVISFQSTSSMLPVYFLNPRPGERVLDLCASPGSKTTLILDLMAGAHDDVGGGGCVCANEVNDGRARELVSRLQNYSPRVVVTRAEGSAFGWTDHGRSRDGPRPPPSSYLAAEGASSSLVDNTFDKVLVDAPCSGEGRMGRDVMAWRLWHPRHCLGFFETQVALLRRAVELCRPGGLVVYATCTLNAVENEAVVSAVLREFAGIVELTQPPPLQPNTGDASTGREAGAGQALLTPYNGETTPLMVLGRGLPRWWVPSASGGFYRSASEARAQEGCHDPLPPLVFFPEDDHSAATSPPGSALSLGEQLSRCCRRVLPHHNGAGSEGFFIAMLRKVRPSASAPHHVLGDGSARCESDDRAGVTTSLPHTGGAPSSSLLHARGLSRLPATNPVLQQLLSPFSAAPAQGADPIARIMNKSSEQVQRLLAKAGWEPLWKADEGLRLTSKDAVAVTRAISAGDGTSAGRRSGHRGYATQLLDLGVLAFDAAGRLTESGAALLRPHASARVLELPAMYVQLLLANHQLDVAANSSDPVAAALQETSNRLVRGDVGSDSGTGSWAMRVLAQIAPHGAGNAIVVIGAAEGTLARQSPQEWARLAKDWAIPVHAELVSPVPPLLSENAAAAVSSSSAVVRLHLLLSREARQRNTAMVGRLQGHERRGATRQGVQTLLAESEGLRASSIMNPTELFGTASSVAARQEALFGAAPAATERTPADAGPVEGAPGKRSTDQEVFEF